MKKIRRTTVVVTVAVVGLLAAPGTAAAAPSCIGGTLTYQGANEYWKGEGYKNLGATFKEETEIYGGIGRFQSAATKALIAGCRG